MRISCGLLKRKETNRICAQNKNTFLQDYKTRIYTSSYTNTSKNDIYDKCSAKNANCDIEKRMHARQMSLLLYASQESGQITRFLIAPCQPQFKQTN